MWQNMVNLSLLTISLALLIPSGWCVSLEHQNYWYPPRHVDSSIYDPDGGFIHITYGQALADAMHFYLWTRSHTADDDYELLNQTESSTLAASTFNPDNPTIFFVHGYTENGLNHYSFMMKDAYLNISDCNFISVDWGAGSGYPYAVASLNTRTAGSQTALLVDLMVDYGLSLSNLHLIGFSLGAQVVGVAGNRMQSGLAGRITGLDPAHPGFNFVKDENLLDSSDGEFVDVIHTNSGTIYSGGLSFLLPVGDVDFYPNGGEHQPGCLPGMIGLILEGGCSHDRAPDYYIESIGTTTAFEACPCATYASYDDDCKGCSDYVLMGANCPSTATGIYFLETHRSSPYSET